ncbi:MAG: HPr family phosphocarrier protein [Lachnospiraceae bacterium]|nr:HPr family phosphocarrier protein [Lachnospiraceae bacterium]
MENKVIRLCAPEDVKEFVSAAEKCDFDIDVIYNRIIVDAKSFLGVLGLVSNPVTVACRGYDSTFENTIKKFAVG